MRAAAQIDEVLLPVSGDNGIPHVLKELHLVAFSHAAEEVDGLLPRHLDALQRDVGTHDLVHLLLDPRQILLAEFAPDIEVIVEPVLNSGAYSESGLRKEPFDGMSHHVSGRVPVNVAGLRGVEGEQFGTGVPGHNGAQAEDFPADTCSDYQSLLFVAYRLGSLNQPPACLDLDHEVLSVRFTSMRHFQLFRLSVPPL